MKNPSDHPHDTESDPGRNANATVDLTNVLTKLRSDSRHRIEEGYTEYLHHFEPQVRNIATSIVHNPAYVDDILSLFRERSAKSLHTFQGTSPGELTNWVHTMAHNLAVDVGKARARDERRRVGWENALLDRQARLLEFQSPKTSTRKRAQDGKYRTCDVIDYLQESQYLQHKLRYLSPNQRECINLRARGHTNPEIADMLHIDPRTVACHVSRGCARLVEFLRRPHHFDDGDITYT